MSKQRLDQYMAMAGMVASRSQAESYIRLGQVMVNGSPATKSGQMVGDADGIKLLATEQYVSRAALKLQSVAKVLKLNFRNRIVLDIGSSTGGFTQFALKQGASKVIAVEVGKEQLHPSLRADPAIELYEQTDIRDVYSKRDTHRPATARAVIDVPDVVVADVSFISLREILPHVTTLCSTQTDIAVMVKPQFEAIQSSFKHKGVIKNDKIRREILKDFEQWAKGNHFVIVDKADSDVAGSKGNVERFYLLHIAKPSHQR